MEIETNKQAVLAVRSRLFFSFGAMLAIIGVLVLAILLFISFGPGPGWPRGMTGVILSLLTFRLVWLSLGEPHDVRATWTGIFSGMTAWMVIGEISPHFGFVKIENQAGLILLIFMTAITIMSVKKTKMPWGFLVFLTSFLLNWWGHAILLPHLYLAQALDEPLFLLIYKLTGTLCLIAFACLTVYIIRKPAKKSRLIYFGLWLYALLVTGIEGILGITEKTFGY